MINRIIDFSLHNRFVVLLMVVLLIAVGGWSMTTLPVDAVPDLTNVQVQVLTTSPSLAPVEMEQFVTFPVETSMSGIPRVKEIRSVTRFGLSNVTIVFEEGTDIYWARQMVGERLIEARQEIPEGLGEPRMGPIATGMGEIYQFEVRAKPGYDYSLQDLRTILDWQVAFQLRSVPGVIEVNTFGGELKTYEVQINPESLLNYNIPLSRVFDALRLNNANAGGGYILHNDEQQLIRGEGLVGSLDDIGDIVLDTRADGTPVRVSDIGDVHFAPLLRQGYITRDGRGEAVAGIVMMLIGENSRVVVDRVKQKVAEIGKGLPEGVHIDPFYDRTDLVRRAIETVTENISGGAILVIIMLFLLVGDWRAGLIVASAIPLSALFTFIAMKAFGVSANLMSLGALDFGIIVDGAVVMTENAIRQVREAKRRNPELQKAGLDVFREAGHEVGRPILFAGAIVIIVFLPILSLQGIEGKMFRPMAFSFMSALIGALILALTVIPMLASLFLARKFNEKDAFLVRWCKRGYAPVLRLAIARPLPTFLIAAVAFGMGVVIASRFGAEFVPKLDEGDIAVQAVRLPSVSLEKSVEITTDIETLLLDEFPDEVESVISKTGRPEIATDPMGVEMSDIFVILKPKDQWRFASKEEMIATMKEALERKIPANNFSFTQPIELRVQELIAGVRSDVGISLYGDDLETLKTLGNKIAGVVQQVPGAGDVQPEQTGGLPYIQMQINRDQIARYGINARDVLDAISIIGGKQVGTVFEGQRRFPLQVRLGPKWREDVEMLKRIKVADAEGRQIPLEQLVRLTVAPGVAQISRDQIRRRFLIQVNVRGRDLASFVADAQEAVDQRVELPPGYRIAWGGSFKNLQEATARLTIAVPLALFLIVSLLYMTFNSSKLALLIFLNVPIATTGGIFALWIRGMPFSISAGVGFIALFGIAVMNGVVLIEHVRHLRQRGQSVGDAVYHGAMDRLRPVLMTATTDALGFIPMAISTSSGAEVQRPLATVVIGGVITSSLLTLVVLPAIYRWFEPKSEDAVQV
ncbi:efflux RND transporter permease subunit [Rhodopirellula bahusiensis]|uniref:CusA/CzcA family heavy metal efflux RND transporter n=1 Tax=Rhodopirellula bahusiensis TaxID=2014065 RepID=A0A2G1VZ61_9BACT|nr:CusA/CzcA family heavy metal efflux RND transporter [Rhodopirellula bahusiensis]PHQ32063.1 CusA/CzcA family heavy metal efflux RND transporter [Rhodopirellula bahusiensis]